LQQISDAIVLPTQNSATQMRSSDVALAKTAKPEVGRADEDAQKKLNGFDAPMFFFLASSGGFPKMVGFPNELVVFLLKMTILVCEIGGTTILGNTQIEGSVCFLQTGSIAEE